MPMRPIMMWWSSLPLPPPPGDESADESSPEGGEGDGDDVEVPLSTFYAVGEPGSPVRLRVHTHVRDDTVEGFRWVRHHAAVRTLVLTLFTFNVTFGAAWSVLVLYATERLGLGEVGFGLITTAGAAGGLLGIVSYGWITRHVSLADVMRIGLVIETLTHVGLALTRSPAVALAWSS